MSGVGKASWVRVPRWSVLVAVSLASLVTACGSSGTQTSCEATGKVYAQKVLVNRGGKKDFDWITLFLVCRPNHRVAIVDSDGKSYESLDDFRANNELLDDDDKISIPRDFPSVEQGRKLELMTVSGHTSTPWGWYVGGGVALVVLAGGGVWFYRRWRVGREWPDEAPPVEQAPDGPVQEDLGGAG